MIRRRK